jgi:hypothetical protein
MGESILGRIALSGESFIACIREAARLAALGAFVALVGGCSNDDTPETALSQRQQAASIGTVTVRIASGDIKDAVPTANSFLDLRDRSSIKSASGTPLPLYNFGSVSTQVGAQVTSGSITSVASVLLRNQTVVQGSVTSGGTITTQAGVTVTGQKLQNQTIPAPVEVSWEVPLAANPANPKTVNTNGTLTLTPGAYGKLTAYAGAKVNLSSGTYAFSDLQVEPTAALRFTVTPANGPVVLYVDKVTWMRGKVETTVPSIPTSKSVLFVHRGTTTVRFETSANMAIVSPNARIELATGGTIYQGSVFAKGLLLEPDVKLTYVPFEYWNFILPPRPTVSCVMPSGRGQHVAAFGYTNGRPVSLQVPLGPLNRVEPNGPGPYGPLTPPTTFESGSHDRVLWVPLDQNDTARWYLLGQMVEASLESPVCEFGSDSPPTMPTVFSEGRTPPRASVPSVPAPRKGTLVLQNASGPGRFHTQQLPPANPPGPPGSPPVVGDPNVTADPGVPPDIPPGLVMSPATTTVQLDVHTVLQQDDPVFEGIDLRAYANLTTPPNVEMAILPTNLIADQSVTQIVPGSGPMLVRHQQIEHNSGSSHESALFEVTVDPVTGTFSGFFESAAISSTWAFPFPFSITSYVPQSTQQIAGTVGVPMTFPFHGLNTATYTLSASTQSTAMTKICANWTAYFVDEELPTPGGVTEKFKGVSLDGGLRVRGYPASFAGYVLSAKGLHGSLREAGRLDRDGCTGDIPARVLQYDGSVTDGSAGGVVVHMKVDGGLRWSGPRGDVQMPVRVAVSVTTETTLHLTDFADQPGWSNQGGILTPPPVVWLTSANRSHGTTAAAIASHVLRRFDDLGLELPPSVYPVEVFDAPPAGTLDFQGNPVGETQFSSAYNLTYVGPAYFQCSDDSPTSPTECRKSCIADNECPGGQHCAMGTDPAEGCDGSIPCFCAWADQGTTKYATTHELGHMVQLAFTGGMHTGGDYTFACTNDSTATSCPTNLGLLDESGSRLIDPPLMDPICGCSHVKSSNKRHCLQSIERVSHADGEGFGQFFASLIWNEPNEQSCVFNYYKEFLDEGADSCRVLDANGDPDPQACKAFEFSNQDPGTITLPPIPVDCGSPAKWRNKNRCTVDDQVEVLQKSAMGTEFDWMTFLYAVQKQVGINQLLRIYNYACHPEIPFDQDDPDDTRMLQCGTQVTQASLPISWVDGAIGGTLNSNGELEGAIAHGGFLSGAQRKWGIDSDEATDLLTLGNAHGVSEDLAPQ